MGNEGSQITESVVRTMLTTVKGELKYHHDNCSGQFFRLSKDIKENQYDDIVLKSKMESFIKLENKQLLYESVEIYTDTCFNNSKQFLEKTLMPNLQEALACIQLVAPLLLSDKLKEFANLLTSKYGKQDSSLIDKAIIIAAQDAISQEYIQDKVNEIKYKGMNQQEIEILKMNQTLQKMDQK